MEHRALTVQPARGHDSLAGERLRREQRRGYRARRGAHRVARDGHQAARARRPLLKNNI
jgi:hypothetical protein